MRLVPVLALVALAAGCNSRSSVPYGACSTSTLCAEATPRCVTFSNRLNGQAVPLCTLQCTTNADCPESGVCVPTETAGLPALCVQRCHVADDCRYEAAICPVVRPGDLGCVP